MDVSEADRGDGRHREVERVDPGVKLVELTWLGSQAEVDQGQEDHERVEDGDERLEADRCVLS
jgi:hypothetical protein